MNSLRVPVPLLVKIACATLGVREVILLALLAAEIVASLAKHESGGASV
jgi:hypothetical protein